jgi:hypothetical protein
VHPLGVMAPISLLELPGLDTDKTTWELPTPPAIVGFPAKTSSARAKAGNTNTKHAKVTPIKPTQRNLLVVVRTASLNIAAPPPYGTRRCDGRDQLSHLKRACECSSYYDLDVSQDRLTGNFNKVS